MRSAKSKTTVVAGAILLIALATALAMYLHREHLERLQGAWEGTMHYHIGQVMRSQRVVLKIFKEHGTYHAVLDQVDLGKKDIPTTTFSVGWSSVAFGGSSNFVFRGQLNNEATEITGRWTWFGWRRTQPLTLTRTETPDAVPEPLAPADYEPRQGSDLQGLWGGTLTIGTNSLRLRLKIAESGDGKFRGELNSLDQSPVIPLPATSVEYHSPGVTVSFLGIGAIFEGRLDDGLTTISGQWTQVKTSPFVLTRIDPKNE